MRECSNDNPCLMDFSNPDVHSSRDPFAGSNRCVLLYRDDIQDSEYTQRIDCNWEHNICVCARYFPRRQLRKCHGRLPHLRELGWLSALHHRLQHVQLEHWRQVEGGASANGSRWRLVRHDRWDHFRFDRRDLGLLQHCAATDGSPRKQLGAVLPRSVRVCTG